jgi:hypothetical protein
LSWAMNKVNLFGWRIAVHREPSMRRARAELERHPAVG